MSKRFWFVLAAIAIIFIGVVIINNGNKANVPSSAKATNHVEGGNAKGIALTEYGDYQCPFCGQYYPIVQNVVARYQNDIQFQFRNLPLTQLHPNAFAAARAAEAADLQGKFWQMHDKLYTSQSDWSGSSNANRIFESYATSLGLNLTKFKADFASKAVNDRINADIAAFNKTGYELSTPTFFLNGKKIQPTSVDAFSKLIDAEIAKKDKTKTTTEQTSTDKNQ